MADSDEIVREDDSDGPLNPTPEEAEFIKNGGKWADWRYKKAEAKQGAI